MNLNRKKNVRFSKRRHILIWPSFNFFFRNRFFKKMQKEECILILLFRDRLVYQSLEVSLFYLDNFESKVKLDLLRQLDIRRQIIRKYYLRYVRTVQKIYSLKQKKKYTEPSLKKCGNFKLFLNFSFFILFLYI